MNQPESDDWIVGVCIPHSFHDFFDYHLDKKKTPIPGARVWVSFRNKKRLGFITHLKNQSSIHTPLKTIDVLVDDAALIPEELLKLCFWIAEYYQAPLSEVLPLAVPKRFLKGLAPAPEKIQAYALSTSPAIARGKIPPQAKQQRALIDFFESTSGSIPLKQIKAQGFKKSSLDALTEKNLITGHFKEETAATEWKVQERLIHLNEEQALAKSCILEKIHEYHCFLLYGVTGSGKTEVYLHVIEAVLLRGKQALIIVPEIGLTPQLLDRFRQRFPVKIIAIHSHLNDTERQNAWLAAKENQAKLIIGTRTAIFTPMPELGLIIIDEEHDASLKQMDGVRYHARDTALIRAFHRSIPVILGSATPSLETFYNCKINKYQILNLKQKAVSKIPLHYQILDIRQQRLEHGLAETTLQFIRKHLSQNQQVLIFINRRGYAPVLLCAHCSKIVDCPHCDAHLTVHRKNNQLICHHCGYTQIKPKACAHCHHPELSAIGQGTQRIHEYLAQIFPDTSMRRIDRDEVKSKTDFEKFLNEIHSGETQLLIGTQMLSKGHHFPRLSLVVVVDGDQGLIHHDFRALERMGQLLTQVAGRAGREDLAGEILIQSQMPHHPELNLLIQKGYTAFSEALLKQRQSAHLPPFQYIALIRAQGLNQAHLIQFLQKIKIKLEANELNCLGPAPAPLARKANHHQLQILITSASRRKLQSQIQETRLWVAKTKLAQGLRWSIDVDAQVLS